VLQNGTLVAVSHKGPGISRGSVVTCLRCDRILISDFVNFKNQLAFAVTSKMAPC